MATDTRHKHEKAGGAPDIVRRQSNHPDARRWHGEHSTTGPFSLMRQMQELLGGQRRITGSIDTVGIDIVSAAQVDVLRGEDRSATVR